MSVAEQNLEEFIFVVWSYLTWAAVCSVWNFTLKNFNFLTLWCNFISQQDLQKFYMFSAVNFNLVDRADVGIKMTK